MLDDFKNTQPLFLKYVSKIIQNGKISHAYLIETNGCDEGFGIALALAKTFLCPKNYTNSSKCVSCNICSNIDKGNYPDLKIIETDGKNIKKEQLLELQEEFKFKNLYGKYLIYIIKQANLLNKASANTILKFLEEPHENIIAILITDNVYNCIDTIVSRCQILSLKNNNTKIKEELYQKYNDLDNIEEFKKNINNFAVFFLVDLENYKEQVIAYQNLYDYKDKLELIFTIFLYFYIEVLNVLLEKTICYMKDYEAEIKKVANKNKICDIIRKIEIVNKFIFLNKLNLNRDLFIDNFIISMGDYND